MIRRVAAWALVAVWGLWALVRVAGLEHGFPLVPLLAFTPYVAALSLVPVAVALVARHRAAAVAAAVIAAVLVMTVLPRAMGDAHAGEATGGTPLRVLTANLYFGRADAATLVDHVRRGRVDVLSVQELTTEAVTGLDAAGLRTLLPYAVLDPAPGAGGSGLYARYPLERLPEVTPTSRMAQPVARLAVPGGLPVEVMAVHPASPVPGLTAVWASDLDALPRADPDGPVRILAGDFNATVDHARLRQLLTSGYRDAAEVAGIGLVPTWPARGAPVPGVMIDHVLTDARCGVRAAAVRDLPGSDHRAVIAEIVLPAG